jgi:hypothetical protein
MSSYVAHIQRLRQHRGVALGLGLCLLIFLVSLAITLTCLALLKVLPTASPKPWSGWLAAGVMAGLRPAAGFAKHTGAILLGSHLIIAFSQPDHERGAIHQHRASRWGSVLAVLLSAACFLLVAGFYFSLTRAQLLIGTDGSFMESLAYSQRLWGLEPGSMGFGLGVNFLQGLGGNISFPLNSLIDLGYAVSFAISGTLHPVISHMVWGLELFGSTAGLGLITGLSLPVAITAGWMAAFLILFPSSFQFYPVAALVPHISTSIMIGTCLYALAIRAASPTKDKKYYFSSTLWQCLLITVLSIYLIAIQPATVLLVAPLAGIVILSAGLSSWQMWGKRQLLLTLLPFIGSVALLILSRPLIYVAGLFANSAASLFAEEWLSDRGSWDFASTLFFRTGHLLIPLAGCGFLLMIHHRRESIELKILGISGISAMSFVLLAGLLNISFPEAFRIPSPIYFEFYAWPLYALSLAYLSGILLQIGQQSAHLALWQLLRSQKSRREHRQRSVPIISALVPSLCLATVIGLIGIFETIGSRTQTLHRNRHPPPLGPIMKQLRTSHGQAPPVSFGGRVATFTGQDLTGVISWVDLHNLDAKLIELFENDYRMSGLWVSSVPTLTEYSPLQSPRSYYLLTRLFALPKDRQIRSILVLRHVNIKMLQLIGVTSIIIDRPIYHPSAKLVAEEQGNDKLRLYLYRVTDSNINGWSPKQILVIPSAKAGIENMIRPEFNPKQMAILESPRSAANQFPLLMSLIEVRKGSYRIQAESKGNSIVVLPIEYSSCFTFRPLAKSSRMTASFPVNISLMAIEFDQHLDVEMIYRSNPFVNQSCRLDDYFKFRQTMRETPPIKKSQT